jgi:hypothetical protein
MREYNAIEQTTKKAGTWMKNPTGVSSKEVLNNLYSKKVKIQRF